jgi:hypothetical protein
MGMIIKNAVSVYCKTFGFSCLCQPNPFVVKNEEEEDNDGGGDDHNHHHDNDVCGGDSDCHNMN